MKPNRLRAALAATLTALTLLGAGSLTSANAAVNLPDAPPVPTVPGVPYIPGSYTVVGTTYRYLDTVERYLNNVDGMAQYHVNKQIKDASIRTNASMTTVDRTSQADLVACRDVIFFGSRGSGQAGNEFPYGFGRQAAAQARVAAGIIEAGSAGVARSVGYRFNPYPAAPVPPNAALYDVLVASAQAGVQEGLASLKALTLQCPAAQIILIGFSQGAAVNHLLAVELGKPANAAIASHVAGIVMIADPMRRVADAGVANLPILGTDLPFDGFFADRVPTTMPSLSASLLSTCNVNDAVCSWDRSTKFAMTTAHTEGYFGVDALADTATKIAGMVR